MKHEPAMGSLLVTGRPATLHWADYAGCVLLMLGLGLRIGLAIRDPAIDYGAGEAARVAVAFARHGVLADAYFDGQGPTAHLMPVMPVIAGTIYRLFGVGSPAASVALLIWAVAQLIAAYLLTYFAFRRMGASRVTLALGALVLAVPIFPNMELRAFRFWDGALCAALVALSFLLIAQRRSTAVLPLAAVGALATLVNPVVGLGLFAAIGAHCWEAGRFRRAVLLGGTLTALLLAPWVVRNQVELGHAAVRSNFWLEVRMAYNSEAVRPTDPMRGYFARINELHPYNSLSARQRVRDLGEVGFNQQMKGEAMAWIAANPGTAAWLTTQHWRDFFFPPTWSHDFLEKIQVRTIAAVVMPMVNFLGLAWLCAGTWTRRRMFRPMFAFVVVVSLPYALVQPVPRYAYVIWPIMVFLAADFMAALYGMVKTRIWPADQAAMPSTLQ